MGSGPGKFNSRSNTNSFSYKMTEMFQPYKNGGYFAGLSKPQYSHQTYYQLADNGAGAGARGDRWLRSQGYQPTTFIPPPLRR